MTTTALSHEADLVAGWVQPLRAHDRISATVRVAMRVRGWSQGDLAERIGLDRAVLNQRLRARARWNSDDLDRLAFALDLDLADLFGAYLVRLADTPGQVRYEAMSAAATALAAASAEDLRATIPYRADAGQRHEPAGEEATLP